MSKFVGSKLFYELRIRCSQVMEAVSLQTEEAQLVQVPEHDRTCPSYVSECDKSLHMIQLENSSDLPCADGCPFASMQDKSGLASVTSSMDVLYAVHASLSELKHSKTHSHPHGTFSASSSNSSTLNVSSPPENCSISFFRRPAFSLAESLCASNP